MGRCPLTVPHVRERGEVFHLHNEVLKKVHCDLCGHFNSALRGSVTVSRGIGEVMLVVIGIRGVKAVIRGIGVVRTIR